MTQDDHAQDERSYPQACAIRPAFAKSGLSVVLPTEGTADDVHALESIGVVATTAPMGARNFHKVSRLTFRLDFRMSQAVGAAICEYDDARIGDDPPADSDAPAGLTCRAPQGTSFALA